MGKTLAEKIIQKHLVAGKAAPGEEITIGVDHVLTQDATGTMVWLEFEAIGVPRVKPEFCIQYIDHNLLQEDNKNMDDHLFLMSMGNKFGAHVSLPGNGISHHIHKERFTKPGKTLIGSDSHTPTAAGGAMLGIGVGGMDAAVGMATGEYTLSMPEVVGVKLTGQLQPWSTAKDVILELLRRVDVDGGKGKIYEYFGPGVKSLDVSERSTIGNMGAETGATTSIFPSDERTREWFAQQERVQDFVPMTADSDAKYADVIEIALDEVEPLMACPHSPGNVKPIREIAGIEVLQTMIGSSTNSSFEEMMRCAVMVDSTQRNMQTFFHVIPGSKQLLETLDAEGGVSKLLKAGARIVEPSCNACIGMGNAPASDIVSVRSFPRNWEGRSGTKGDQIFLSSPEAATAAAIKGEIVDPRDLGIKWPGVKPPKRYIINDSMVLAPRFEDKVRRGPNIKELPYRTGIEDMQRGKVVIKVGDDISTDHIMPAGAKVLPFRSNVPAISEFVFSNVDAAFVKRCKEWKGGFIVGGDNYGQGSSREHAALAPMYLGIKAVLVKSAARIHKDNLVNFGIVPVEFADKADYEKIEQGDELEIVGVHAAVKSGKVTVNNKSKGVQVRGNVKLNHRQQDIILKGGLLTYIRAVLGH